MHAARSFEPLARGGQTHQEDQDDANDALAGLSHTLLLVQGYDNLL